MPNKNFHPLRKARPVQAPRPDAPRLGQVYASPAGKCWTVVKLAPLTLTEALPEHPGFPETRRPSAQGFARDYRKVTD